MGDLKGRGRSGLNLRGIRAKWMLNSMLLVVLALLLGLAAYSFAISNYYYSGIRSTLESKAKTSSDFFANYVTRTYAEYYQSAYKYTEIFDGRDRMELQFVNSTGRILVSTSGLSAGSHPNTPDITEAISTCALSTWQGRSPATGERILAVSSPLLYGQGQVVGVIRYVTSLRLVDRQVFLSILVGCGIGLGVILVVLISNLFFIRSILSPIQKVTVMTRRIADGGFGAQIENKYEDEIGDMVGAINEMSMQLSQSEKMKAEFISSVSHELRTPLTAIAGWGETLEYDETLSEDSRKGLDIILKEARRLSNMVEELLVFTRIEDGRFTVNIEMLDVGAELEEAIFTYRELLKQEGIQLFYDPPEDPLPLIPGDPERLKQVILNILDNAAKHGGSGKRITVTSDLVENAPETGCDCVRIRIRDYGPGIPPDELPRVKLKFYKGSSKARGSGIGLAVCDEIIRRHNGVLDIANADEGTGTVVTILLPTTE